MVRRVLIIGILMSIFSGCAADKSYSYTNNKGEVLGMEQNYYFPSEEEKHEGTWVIWPHEYAYGKSYKNEIEPIWIEVVKALYEGENIHVIAYDEKEKEYISELMVNEDIDMSKVDFVIGKSNDFWARDTAPIFVLNHEELRILDFGFDGWGGKTKYNFDDELPRVVGDDKKISVVDVSDFILEGGSVELDGKGTLMATKSSVISKNRNQDLTIEEAEEYLSKYFGVDNFIWIEGVTDEDITDAHIDGIARFAKEDTIVTVSEEDFLELYENIKISDYETLINSKNREGNSYEIICLPMTSRNVKGLDYKGSYINYYVGNEVVLMPSYNDKNDCKALEILQEIYPEREVVPIDVISLYKYGGMIHCITQQQPQSNR